MHGVVQPRRPPRRRVAREYALCNSRTLVRALSATGLAVVSIDARGSHRRRSATPARACLPGCCARPAAPDPDFSASLLADLSSVPAVTAGVTAQFMACYMPESRVRAASRLDTGAMVSMEDASCTSWSDSMPAAVEAAAATAAAAAGGAPASAASASPVSTPPMFKRLRSRLGDPSAPSAPSAAAPPRPVKIVNAGP